MKNPSRRGSGSVPHDPRKARRELPAADAAPRSPSGDAAQDENGEAEERKQPRVDFVSKNQERLREMQEARARELKEIEDQRARVLRRQEKLKQNVLKDA